MIGLRVSIKTVDILLTYFTNNKAYPAVCASVNMYVQSFFDKKMNIFYNAGNNISKENKH